MSHLKETIYRWAPLPLKTALFNAVARQNSKKRYSEAYLKQLAEYLELWLSDRTNVLSYQERMLTKLLLECYDFVPFYRRAFEEQRINPEEIRRSPYDALKKVPLLSKDDRKKKVDDLINANPQRPVKDIGFTSGTSGSPTVIYSDEESITRAFALWSRFHQIIGIKKGDRSVRFSGRIIINPKRKKPPFWILNAVDQQLFMSTYHLTAEHLRAYVSKINEFKPLLIDGYPSAIFVLAKFINKQHIDLTFTPKAITTTAETLYDYQREAIKQAFHCKVYNQYASSEGSPFITECQAGKLHINEDSGVFEFLNNQDEPAKPGEPARMVVTSFRNWKTPLLRYDIGDTVLLSKDQTPCSCGCQMHYVEKIIGREDDVLWTEEKGYVGRMDTAYKGLEGIVKSQLIQKTKDFLEVNQVVDDRYTDKMNQLLLRNLRDRLGEKITIKINLVDNIPLGASGKFDAVKRAFKIEG